MRSHDRETRVLHIPCNTPYIRNLQAKEKIRIINGTTLLGETTVPIEVTFGWVAEQSEAPRFWDSFDVCHIHFGFELESIGTVSQVLQLLKNRFKPILYTYHEPNSVHGVGDVAYRNCIGLLLQHASSVVAMTCAARDQLAHAFPGHIQAEVITKGGVLDPNSELFGHAHSRGSLPEVVLFGALRSNRDIPTTLLNIALTFKSECRIALITRAFTRHQLDESGSLRAALMAASGNSLVSIEPILPVSDDEVAARLRQADVLILPYNHAGHSGQLELAYDCGLIPVATNVGFLKAQTEVWPPDEDHLAPAIFVDWQDGREWLYQARMIKGVREALANLSLFEPWQFTESRRAFRLQEHQQVVEKHYQMYVRVIEQAQQKSK